MPIKLLWYGDEALYIVIFALFKIQMLMWQNTQTLLSYVIVFFTVMLLLQQCNPSIFLLVSSEWMNLIWTVSRCPEMLYNQRAAALTQDGPRFRDALPLNAIRAHASAETRRKNKGKKEIKTMRHQSLRLPGHFVWSNSTVKQNYYKIGKKKRLSWKIKPEFDGRTVT